MCSVREEPLELSELTVAGSVSPVLVLIFSMKELICCSGSSPSISKVVCEFIDPVRSSLRMNVVGHDACCWLLKHSVSTEDKVSFLYAKRFMAVSLGATVSVAAGVDTDCVGKVSWAWLLEPEASSLGLADSQLVSVLFCEQSCCVT